MTTCSSRHGSLTCGTASPLSGNTPRPRGRLSRSSARRVSGTETLVDDLDSVEGISSVACSRCSYVTGCDVSDSVSNVYATTAAAVSVLTAEY